MTIKIHLFLSLLLLSIAVRAQSDIEDFLNKHKDIKVEKLPANIFQKEAYQLFLRQPIDHNDTTKGYFDQLIWLTHVDADAPTVLVTEGYTAGSNRTYEITRMLKANQIVVEHRYFGMSTPAPLDWTFLTVEQAANDHHKIVELFKEVYKGKWLNTGISKGGSTTMFHRAFFPDDVDVSLPYVAPLNFAREDVRLFDFFHQIHSPVQRKAMRDFQRLVLEKREIMLQMMKDNAKRLGLTFKMGYEKAFELAVMEYPFAFLQWGQDINKIPTKDASDKEIFNHFMRGSDFSYVSDRSLDGLKSFFYQAYKELGYYAYVPGDLKPLMKAWKQDTISSSVLLEKSDTLTFQPQTMQYVIQQLRKHNPKMIAIVGETDPWGSTSIEAPDLSNTMKIVKPEGSHLTRIGNLPPHLKERVYRTLEEWMGVKIERSK